MLMNAKNTVLRVNGWTMDHIRFGKGEKTLVILPGLGDGLRTVKGTALPMALMYRMFAGDYTVYAFSRKNELEPGCTTRDMARDLADAMTALGIAKADVFGVSMGGMIAQHLAIDHPEKVGKLVLVVTAAEQNPILQEAVTEWISLAKQGDHTGLMESNLRRIYSEDYYRKNRWMIPVTGALTKPKSYDRFFRQAEACLTHDALVRLKEITAPTLVIGGMEDKSLGVEASRTIAGEIPGAELKLYEKLGHGLYEEAPDFLDTVLAFLRR
jgi:pimeloyl-ACP methyl ester carboxylesterase